METDIFSKYALKPAQLRRTCEAEHLDFSTTDELVSGHEIIGQERATRALKFGLGIKALGFNIYVAGAPGTGRTMAVRSFLERIAKDQSIPPDWCYVNNFRDPSQPIVISLPAGMGHKFQADMQALIEQARREILSAFESEEYIVRKEETTQSFQKQREEIEARINQVALQSGFIIQASPMGISTIPLRKGKPVTEEEFISLDTEEKQDIARRQQGLQVEIETALRQTKTVAKRASQELQLLDQKIGAFTLKPLFDDLKDDYQQLDEVAKYLEEVRIDILENLAQFKGDTEEQQEAQSPLPWMRRTTSNRYAVNPLVDNAALNSAPVIIELNPTFNNLIGRIENEAQFGTLVTDFTLIRNGSLHRANGGYLVLPAEELLRAPFAWDSLKRALRNQRIEIEDLSERLGLLTTKRLQPQPIPLDVKVILIGQNMLYHLLQTYDEDFGELFKVKADFDTRMDRSDETVRDYATFASAVGKMGELKHLDNFGLAALVEHGSRLAEDQEKLSTRFGELADVIREASYYASQEATAYINAAQIRKAIDEKYYRSSLVKERLREMTERGVLMIDVAGEKVGQVNGLSVLGLGDISFGQPSRITASVGVGRDGVVDIEREAELGGPTHTKGVLILAGYLSQKYAQDKPLALSARLVFEQSYSGVDGDSASSAELYAIISALSGLPLKQGIAVTGSINQKGEIQAIGGVNEKVEGFFEVCNSKGLTGEQGVIIPASNAQNLMLKDEVINIVSAGRFHVWTVSSVDEGIEILTGVSAGVRDAEGNFETETVNYRVDMRLREMGEVLSRFGKEEKREETG